MLILLLYEMLCDFGFVHQVLTYIRQHEGSVTSESAKPLNTIIWSNLDLFVRYGPVFLSEQEFHVGLRRHLTRYYRFLADSFFGGRNREFWGYHWNGLRTVGYPLSLVRLAGGIARAAVCRLRATARRILRAFRIR